MGEHVFMAETVTFKNIFKKMKTKTLYKCMVGKMSSASMKAI